MASDVREEDRRVPVEGRATSVRDHGRRLQPRLAPAERRPRREPPASAVELR